MSMNEEEKENKEKMLKVLSEMIENATRFKLFEEPSGEQKLKDRIKYAKALSKAYGKQIPPDNVSITYGEKE